MDDVERVARAIHQSDEDTMTLLHIDVKPWDKITGMEKEAYIANARAALAAMGPVKVKPLDQAEIAIRRNAVAEALAVADLGDATDTAMAIVCNLILDGWTLTRAAPQEPEA